MQTLNSLLLGETCEKETFIIHFGYVYVRISPYRMLFGYAR